MKAAVTEVINIFNSYNYRELEVNFIPQDKVILIYEYIQHTKDEESGEFIAETSYDTFSEAFENVFGRKPNKTDYTEI